MDDLNTTEAWGTTQQSSPFTFSVLWRMQTNHTRCSGHTIMRTVHRLNKTQILSRSQPTGAQRPAQSLGTTDSVPNLQLYLKNLQSPTIRTANSEIVSGSSCAVRHLGHVCKSSAAINKRSCASFMPVWTQPLSLPILDNMHVHAIATTLMKTMRY